MNTNQYPVTMAPRQLAEGWSLLPSFMPIPGMGVLAVNAFVLDGGEPMLVDTGLGMLADDWLARLDEVVDPGALKWIWISHADADHIGNLSRLLEVAPHATVLTSFLGQGKLAMAGFDPTRMQLVEPGRTIEFGDRRLVPVRPPYYDAPETLGLFDPSASVLFAADCFGALLPEPVEQAEEAGDAALREGMVQWSAVDAPWLGQADPGRLSATLEAFGKLAPRHVLSGHLPPVDGGLDVLAPVIVEAWCKPGGAPADPWMVDAVTTALHDHVA